MILDVYNVRRCSEIFVCFLPLTGKRGHEAHTAYHNKHSSKWHFAANNDIGSWKNRSLLLYDDDDE